MLLPPWSLVFIQIEVVCIRFLLFGLPNKAGRHDLLGHIAQYGFRQKSSYQETFELSLLLSQLSFCTGRGHSG